METSNETNAIKKNMHYKKCLNLWNFIYAYDKVGYTVNLVKHEPIISKEFEKDIYDSFIWNYAMIHNQVEDANKININHDIIYSSFLLFFRAINYNMKGLFI